MSQPDHFMYGAPDRDEAMESLESFTGVRPSIGGSHRGKGTRNALLSLGDSVYLEIIAPDPEQDLTNNFGGFLGDLESPGLITWCASHPNLVQAATDMKSLEFEPNGPAAWSRKDPTGNVLAWELLFINGHDLGTIVPFLIDWKNAPHPAGFAPKGCTIKSFELRTPGSVLLRGVLDMLGLKIPIKNAAVPAIDLILNTPKGEVRLPAANPLPSSVFF